MQVEHPIRVVNGSANVELLFVLGVTGVSGTYTAGHTLSFTGGAAGVLVKVTGALLTAAITSVQQPLLGDTVTSSGGATGTLDAFDLQPDLAGSGIDGDEFMVRDGDGVAYIVSAVPSNSQVQLAAPYGGVSSSTDEALGVFHTTRTPSIGLPDFDRRDRNLPVLLKDAMRILDTVLADHEARIAALEP